MRCFSTFPGRGPRDLRQVVYLGLSKLATLDAIRFLVHLNGQEHMSRKDATNGGMIELWGDPVGDPHTQRHGPPQKHPRNIQSIEPRIQNPTCLVKLWLLSGPRRRGTADRCRGVVRERQRSVLGTGTNGKREAGRKGGTCFKMF